MDIFNLYCYNMIGIKSVYGSARLNSFFGDEYIYGSYLSRLLFLLVAITYKIEFLKKIHVDILVFFILLFTSLSIFISGERTAFFLFLIAFTIFLLLSNYKLLSKFLTVGIGSVIIIFIFFLNTSVNERYSNLLLKELGIKKWENVNLSYENKRITFLPQHTSYFIVASKMFNEKKIIGHGNKSFSFKCQDYVVNQASCSSIHTIYIFKF